MAALYSCGVSVQEALSVSMVNFGSVVSCSQVEKEGFSTSATGDYSYLGDTSSTMWMASRFSPAASYIVNALEVKMRKEGSPTFDITVELFASSADPFNTPSGSALISSSTIAASSLETSFGLVSVPLPAGYSISAGTKYWVSFKASSQGDSSNRIHIAYANAERLTSSANGTSWSYVTAAQYYLKTFACE